MKKDEKKDIWLGIFGSEALAEAEDFSIGGLSFFYMELFPLFLKMFKKK